MNKTLKIIGIVILVVAVLFVVFKPSVVRYGDSSTLSGGLTILNSNSGDYLTVGSGGSGIAKILKGSATSCTASTSVPANKSATLECAVSGVIPTDMVFVSSGATSSNVSLAIVNAYASTTNGYIDFQILNASTSAITSSQNDVRNADYLIIR